MSEPRVRTFFYGSYMSPAVLREAGVAPAALETACLCGYGIRIGPRANLVPSPLDCVYGVVAEMTHTELARLYAHAKDVLGETYLPHPVIVQTLAGAWLAALCYIAPAMAPAPPDPSYVDRIVQPARAFKFPRWYVEQLESIGRGK